MSEKNLYAIISIMDSTVSKREDTKMHKVTICAVYQDYDYLFNMIKHMVGITEDGCKRDGYDVKVETKTPQGSQKWLHETNVYISKQEYWMNYSYRIYEIQNNPFLDIDNIFIREVNAVEESV